VQGTQPAPTRVCSGGKTVFGGVTTGNKHNERIRHPLLDAKTRLKKNLRTKFKNTRGKLKTKIIKTGWDIMLDPVITQPYKYI